MARDGSIQHGECHDESLLQAPGNHRLFRNEPGVEMERLGIDDGHSTGAAVIGIEQEIVFGRHSN